MSVYLIIHSLFFIFLFWSPLNFRTLHTYLLLKSSRKSNRKKISSKWPKNALLKHKNKKCKKRSDIPPSNLLTDDSTAGTRMCLASESGRVPAISTVRWPLLNHLGDLALYQLRFWFISFHFNLYLFYLFTLFIYFISESGHISLNLFSCLLFIVCWYSWVLTLRWPLLKPREKEHKKRRLTQWMKSGQVNEEKNDCENRRAQATTPRDLYRWPNVDIWLYFVAPLPPRSFCLTFPSSTPPPTHTPHLPPPLPRSTPAANPHLNLPTLPNPRWS